MIPRYLKRDAPILIITISATAAHVAGHGALALVALIATLATVVWSRAIIDGLFHDAMALADQAIEEAQRAANTIEWLEALKSPPESTSLHLENAQELQPQDIDQGHIEGQRDGRGSEGGQGTQGRERWNGPQKRHE